MHQSVKLTDAIWLLQQVIFFTLIHELGHVSQARGPQLEGGDLPTELSLPPAFLIPNVM